MYYVSAVTVVDNRPFSAMTSSRKRVYLMNVYTHTNLGSSFYYLVQVRYYYTTHTSKPHKSGIIKCHDVIRYAAQFWDEVGSQQLNTISGQPSETLNMDIKVIDDSHLTTCPWSVVTMNDALSTCLLFTVIPLYTVSDHLFTG